MKHIIFSISCVFLFVIQSCYNRPDISDVPSLAFISMNTKLIKQGFSKEDSIEIYLELTDGDGDIGFEESDSISKSILITDLRTGNVSEQFKIPVIPKNVVANGLQAELMLKLYTTCCLFPDNIPPCTKTDLYPRDSLVYEIVIIDRAGNQSEPIETPTIILVCD